MVVVLDERVWLDVLPALENKNRFSILKLLLEEGKKSWSEITTGLGLTPGNSTHHLNVLLDRELVSNSYMTPEGEETDYSHYELTELGITVMERLLRE